MQGKSRVHPTRLRPMVGGAMSHTHDWEEIPAEVVTVVVYGGPYDGGVLHVPKAEDGTYGSVFGRVGMWAGLPVSYHEDHYRLDWFELETQAIVFAESRSLLNKLSALAGMRVR